MPDSTVLEDSEVYAEEGEKEVERHIRCGAPVPASRLHACHGSPAIDRRYLSPGFREEARES